MSNFTATSWFLGYGDQPGVAVCDAMSLCMCFCCCTAFFKVSLVGDGSQQAGKAQSLHFSLQREHFFYLQMPMDLSSQVELTSTL
jgi:hypothetical protein